RLEDEMYGAGEITALRKRTSGAEQHRRVAIVTAGMHLALYRRLVRPVGKLRHGQRVHVGAKADGAGAVAHLQRADDAGSPKAPMHGCSCLLQQAGDDPAGADLLEAEFRMGVKITAQFGEERNVGFDRISHQGSASHYRAIISRTGEASTAPVATSAIPLSVWCGPALQARVAPKQALNTR